MAQLHIAVSNKLCLIAAPASLKQWMQCCVSAGYTFQQRPVKVEAISNSSIDGNVCVVCVDDLVEDSNAPAKCVLLDIFRHASANTKVIAVTKIQDPKRRQVILRSGANDILMAPFQHEEFLWRIHRIKQCDLTQLEFGGWQINLSTGEAHHPDRGVRVHLTPAELSIISKLWKAQGSVVLRTELAEEIGTKASLGRSLNTLVLRLRKKLEKDAQVPQFILTVPKRGYRLRVPS